MSDTVLARIRAADLFVLNKIDLISEKQVQKISKELGLQNENAPITPVIFGKVEPDIFLRLFGIRTFETVKHQHFVGLSTLTLAPKNNIEGQELPETLVYAYPNVNRAKGFAKNELGDTILIQIVGSRFSTSFVSIDFSHGIVCLGSGKPLSMQYFTFFPTCPKYDILLKRQEFGLQSILSLLTSKEI